MKDLCENVIENELLKNGSFAACAKGNSMRPMLRDGLDMVIIERPGREIKKYDVILYKDPTGRYVLHRVVKVKGDDFITRGDNCYFNEVVPLSSVLGILVAYNKNGKRYECNSFGFRAYSGRRVFFYPLRKLILCLRRFPARVYKKLFKKRVK